MFLGNLRGKTKMTAEVQGPEGAVEPNCQQSGTMCTKQVEKEESYRWDMYTLP